MDVEILGFAAGIMGVIALLPQVMKSWQTKSTKDISLGWSTLAAVSQILWITYGTIVSSSSLTIMSSVNLLLTLSVLALKLKYGMKKQRR